VERVDLLVNGDKRALVHNYGAGGTGFQAGYGMGLEAVATVEELLQEMKDNVIQARL
jgi:D-amino-acid oxidase